MPRREKLSEIVAWCQKNITGDEKGQAQIFLDRLFQAFGQLGSLDVGGHPEFRIRKADEDGGGTVFADYVSKPVVFEEMKKTRQKIYRRISPVRQNQPGEWAGTMPKKQEAANSVLLKSDSNPLNAPGRKPPLQFMRGGYAGGLRGIC
jgi:hypothetical protein